MICQRCKAEVAGSPKFCPKCGTKFDVSAVQAMAEAAPAALSVAPQDSVICPKCGTPNSPTARFCKTDGTPLWDGASSPQPAAPLTAAQTASQPTAPRSYTAFQPVQPPMSKSRKTILIGSMIAVVMLASGIGGYLYWAGYVGDRQGSVAQTLNSELSSKGLGNVKVNVNKEWKASVEGLVASQAEKDQALALLQSRRELNGVIDTIRIKPGRADLEQMISKALADAGMMQVTVQIDEKLTTVTLNDPALGPEDRAKAEKLVIATADATGATSMKVAHAAPTPQLPTPLPEPATATAPSPVLSPAPPPVDVTSVARGLKEALRSAGLDSVAARVDASGNVILQGTVATRKDKDQAIRIVLAQAGVTGVNDFIRLIPPASAAAPPQTASPIPAPAPAEARDPAKLEGEINRALRSRDIGGVSAQVGDDFSITLKGSTTSAAQKEQAFQLARQFKSVGAIRDRVFVVEQ